MKHQKNEFRRFDDVAFDTNVDMERISVDATIHPGCRIRGAETSIGPGCVIGEEAPATIENCQLGRDVRLKGGYFSGATFLDGSGMGTSAHVRAGTILEEEASGAHAVGLKQTILMPFVTLGSLINFCDILMAGGTSRKNHSEVGSSYIHFNYTPHQDKATASLVGDVPQGVFLDKPPIFLGGQGGLVGPARIAYGSVVAAGGICRRDIAEEGGLHVLDAPMPGARPFQTGVYRGIERIVRNNLLYIGNVAALQVWYRHVRSLFMCRDAFDARCHEGALHNLDIVLKERIKRLGELAAAMESSCQWWEQQPGDHEKTIAEQRLFRNSWETIDFELRQSDWRQDAAARDRFLSALAIIPSGGSYVQAIGELDADTRKTGVEWLQSIVDEVARLWPPAQA